MSDDGGRCLQEKQALVVDLYHSLGQGECSGSPQTWNLEGRPEIE